MSTRYTGRVKWFNNKAGYGFITVTDGDMSGTDVFVHHSAIETGAEQYKYLVQGEYVELGLSEVENDKHDYQASGVSGVKGGKLMCETRYDNRVARSEYRSSKEEDKQEWTYVGRVKKGLKEESNDIKTPIKNAKTPTKNTKSQPKESKTQPKESKTQPKDNKTQPKERAPRKPKA